MSLHIFRDFHSKTNTTKPLPPRIDPPLIPNHYHCPSHYAVVDKVVECVLLGVIPQSGFEFRRHLFPETVVQELSHAHIEVFLDAGQSVTFVGIDLATRYVGTVPSVRLESSPVV